MPEIILDTLLDSLKLMPLLFAAYLFMEYTEHKMNPSQKMLTNSKFSVAIASVLGAIPQCGFSASASSLYSAGMITYGTLIAVYLSTSDEMLPIMLSEGVSLKIIISVIVIKIISGIIFGYTIDASLKKKRKPSQDNIKNICSDEHCHCEKKSIFISALTHTLNVTIFITLISFLLNLVLKYASLESLTSLKITKPYISEIILPLIGLIPNCASSVFITELYISSIITPAAMISALLANSGVGMLVLFKQNKNIKENIATVALTYLISALTGIALELIGFTL